MNTINGTVRERIVAAARAEFAEHGMAGARIGRIAARAATSKERIYAYFRTKQELLEEISATRYAHLTAIAAIDANDLPGFVGRLFDHYIANPDELRLNRWAGLEDVNATLPPDSPRIAMIDAGAREIARGQALGLVDPGWRPLDLFSMLVSLAMAWPSAPPEVRQSSDAWHGDAGDITIHRAAAVEAARRLTTPR